MSSVGCGVNRCLTGASCTKCCNVCKTPTGPTVNAAADMMASTIAARAGQDYFPTNLAKKGVKLTRPSYNNLTTSRNIHAWVNATYCCT